MKGTGGCAVRKNRRRIAAFALAVLLPVLAACGGGSGGGSSAGGTIDVTIGVGGQASIVYLPTTLAQQLGYYEEEGLNVTLQDFQGGAKSLEALMGGSVDVVSGYYDHTNQMAAKGQKLKSFVTMLRYPGLVMAVSPETDKPIGKIEDLKGAVVGVSAPGSSTHLFLNYLLSKKGLDPRKDVSVIGIGLTGTAIAAMEKGEVDAAVLTDPAATQLAKRHPDLKILMDTRTAEGVKQAFGTETYPASVLYSKAEWIEQNPEAARRLARAIQRTLKWIQQHSPREIAEKMPSRFHGGDESTYVEAIDHTMPMFSPDGVMHPEGPQAVKEVLSLSLEEVRRAKFDLKETYTNEFVQ
jgi:NitT/TauT family transport system substrate-binding protein|nr:ABC transporter substrate-binding protein [Bacillota bacterium]